jgi:amino acid transporter
MKSQQNNLWQILPKYLINLLGAEFDILEKAGSKVLNKFYFAAITMVIVIIISLASIWYSIELLFRDLLTEAFLSAFFAFLLGCIYIFIINTFSKEKEPGQIRHYSLSNIIRTGFIIFIAFLIAQPLGIIANGKEIKEQTQQYKERVLKNYLQTIHSFYNIDFNKLNNRKLYCIQQRIDYGTHQYDEELNDLENTMTEINKKVIQSETVAKIRISENNFFLYQIQQGVRYWQTWILTIFLMLIFLLPGYLIYSISSENEYYKLKKAGEKRMILQLYVEFTQNYSKLFEDRFGKNIKVLSIYEDPPFKYLRKSAPLPSSVDAFLNKYITAED